jgi:hypothetical protein
VALFPKLDLIALLVDSSFGSAIYVHGVFSSISFRGVNNNLVPPTRDTPIFKGRPGDYGPKSRCGTEWNPFEVLESREKTPWRINRNHQSLRHSVLISGGSACLFLGQSRGLRCHVTSSSKEVVKAFHDTVC